MHACERLLVNCSHSSPVRQSLVPAVLGAVSSPGAVVGVSCLLHHHSSQHTISPPCQALMAHSAAMLMSPTKRPFCSSSSGGGGKGSSPARSLALVLSPSSVPAAVKRPLQHVLQCCTNSSHHSSTSAHAAQQQHGSVPAACPPPAPAAHAGSSEVCGPSWPAAKRLEVVQGSGGACQPITPAISQPEPLATAAGGGGSSGGPGASAQLTPAVTSAAAAAAAATTGGSSSSPAGRQATPTPAAAQLWRPNDNDCVCLDQLPSPNTILDAPPVLAPSPGGQHQVVSRECRPGHKIPIGLDIAINVAFLDQFPEHQPQLGSGRLDVIVGPMFAGKTTALLRRLQDVAGVRPFIAVKSAKDTRYSNYYVVTHGGKSVRAVPAHSLAEFKAHMGTRWHRVQVIAIDEAQFFPDLVEFCTEAVDHYGKHVIVAGLSGDFLRRRFGQVLDLLPLADSVQTLRSVCSVCHGKHGPGLFSTRKVAGGPQEVVGGGETYVATCRRCYLEAQAAQH